MQKPRVFICHCEKNIEPTDYAIRIIHALGCTPVIAELHPKKSRTIHLVVKDSMNTCNAVVVLATADYKNGNKYAPSSGVAGELALLKNSKKFRNKYFVIKEKSVALSAMNDESRYTFTKRNFSEIAFAIVFELGNMDIFKNYYELKGSELKVHKLLDTLHNLKELFSTGVMKKEHVEEILKEYFNNLLNVIIGKTNER